jgi:hypothetical protein
MEACDVTTTLLREAYDGLREYSGLDPDCSVEEIRAAERAFAEELLLEELIDNDDWQAHRDMVDACLTDLERAVRDERREAAIAGAGSWLAWINEVAELTPEEARVEMEREDREVRTEAALRLFSGRPSSSLELGESRFSAFNNLRLLPLGQHTRRGTSRQGRPGRRRASPTARSSARSGDDPPPDADPLSRRLLIEGAAA